MGQPATYREIWCIDFEFHSGGRDGNPPHPVCCVAQELNSLRVIKLWGEEIRHPPFDLAKTDVLTLAYFASAESNCMTVLGWRRPSNVLDLYAEFRVLTNGKRLSQGNGLLGAAAYFGLNTISMDQKSGMRDLILGGGPFSESDRRDILEYCTADVFLTARLYAAMLPHLTANWNQALVRGRYMEVVGRVENRGVPVDDEIHARLAERWHDIRLKLIEIIDQQYGVYIGTTFKSELFERYLARSGIPWPRLDSGALCLDESTFKDQARLHPQLKPLKELRSTLGQLRLNSLSIGSDGRNRCLLSPFSSRTGRNQPSNSRFIFGPSAWIRSLIKPPKGYGLAYCDYARQEFGIAAALSSDERMSEVYSARDSYIAFAQMAGAVPEGAAKESHPVERGKFKLVALAVQYGMTAFGLSNRSGMGLAEARQLLRFHRQAFPGYWQWSEQVEAFGTLTRELRTSMGWRIQYPGWNPLNLRSMRNWPIQATGSDMLRLAMIALDQAGVEVVAPVHDAVLIQCPLENMDEVISETRSIMRRVSAQLLGQIELGVDVDRTCWPERYVDGRGLQMWNQVLELAGQP